MCQVVYLPQSSRRDTRSIRATKSIELEFLIQLLICKLSLLEVGCPLTENSKLHNRGKSIFRTFHSTLNPMRFILLQVTGDTQARFLGGPSSLHITIYVLPSFTSFIFVGLLFTTPCSIETLEEEEIIQKSSYVLPRRRCIFSSLETTNNRSFRLYQSLAIQGALTSLSGDRVGVTKVGMVGYWLL